MDAVIKNTVDLLRGQGQSFSGVEFSSEDGRITCRGVRPDGGVGTWVETGIETNTSHRSFQKLFDGVKDGLTLPPVPED